MIHVYLFAFVLGGVLLVASILLGGDADGDGALDVEGGGETAGGTDSDSGSLGVVAALRSLRFWTFLTAFFGLTGLVLGGFDLAPPWITLALAVAVGAGTAAGAAAVLQWLQKEQSGAAAEAGDYVGKTARVIVGFKAGATGKVRVELRGAEVDLLARTDDEHGFSSGDAAVIIDIDDTVARVARLSAFHDSPVQS